MSGLAKQFHTAHCPPMPRRQGMEAGTEALSVGLAEFGLSKYEARAYVTLVSKGGISASELAHYSDIPRPKAYPTLHKLETKGLAILHGGKPTTWTPVAPEDAFDGIVQDQIGRIEAMNSLVADLKKTNDGNRRSRGAREKTYIGLEASGTLGQMRRMIDGATKTVCAMADRWMMGLLAECGDQLVSADRRGVDVMIVMPLALVGSRAHRAVPGGAAVRISETVHNCIVFDGVDVIAADSSSGKADAFPSAGALGAATSALFARVWEDASGTACMDDMTSGEASEVYGMVRLVGEEALGHVLGSDVASRRGLDLLGMLEGRGIDLNGRPVDDVVELVDSALQIACSGHADLDDKAGNIAIRSAASGGRSLPWASILDGYLRRAGYSTRMTYKKGSGSSGEMVHLKFAAAPPAKLARAQG